MNMNGQCTIMQVRSGSRKCVLFDSFWLGLHANRHEPRKLPSWERGTYVTSITGEPAFIPTGGHTLCTDRHLWKHSGEGPSIHTLMFSSQSARTRMALWSCCCWTCSHQKTDFSGHHHQHELTGNLAAARFSVISAPSSNCEESVPAAN